MDFKTVMIYHSFKEAQKPLDELIKRGYEARLIDNKDENTENSLPNQYLVVELQVKENNIDYAYNLIDFLDAKKPIKKSYKQFMKIGYLVFVAFVLWLFFIIYLLNYYSIE